MRSSSCFGRKKRPACKQRQDKKQRSERESNRMIVKTQFLITAIETKSAIRFSFM